MYSYSFFLRYIYKTKKRGGERMKRLVSVSLSLILCLFLLQGPAYAISLKDDMNMPMWVDSRSSKVNLTINQGKVVASARLIGKSGTTKVSATMSLQKKSGSSWTTVKTWSSSNSGSSLSFSRSASVSKGNTYRLHVKITTVTNGRSETSTMYSNQAAY